MTDRKLISRLSLMLDHAKRALDMDNPDLRVVEKLLADAVCLAAELNEPPNPYADEGLRPGLKPYDINRDPAGLLDQLMDRPKEADHG